MKSHQELVELATKLADRLEDDIKLARTRDEHLRVTARANEARQLLNELLVRTTVEL
jgi:hypothetical protein